MKKLTFLLIAVLTSIVVAAPAQAKLRIGPRLGVDVSTLRFNKDLFKSENCAGFTGGLILEVSLPLGLCVDGSVMYVRRNISAVTDNSSVSSAEATRDYINVPINLKWNLGLPLVGKAIAPYIFTGPDFAFLASKEAIQEAWESKKVDVAWNFGLGLQLIKHLQISAAYGISFTKLKHLTTPGAMDDSVFGRNNNWTVTAAWLF